MLECVHDPAGEGRRGNDSYRHHLRARNLIGRDLCRRGDVAAGDHAELGAVSPRSRRQVEAAGAICDGAAPRVGADPHHGIRDGEPRFGVRDSAGSRRRGQESDFDDRWLGRVVEGWTIVRQYPGECAAVRFHFKGLPSVGGRTDRSFTEVVGQGQGNRRFARRAD